MTLEADEFLRRFLLHVLPSSFVRIRYFGLLANRQRAQLLNLCRSHLQVHGHAASYGGRGASLHWSLFRAHLGARLLALLGEQ